MFLVFNAQSPSDCKSHLTPPHALLRSKTSRKPHRSSPLAGPAVLPLNNNGESATSSKSVSRLSSSLSLYDFGHSEVSSLSSSQGLSRPTSMISMGSAVSYTLSQDSSIPRRRSMAPKELIRPMSAFPLHLNSHSGCSRGLCDGHLSRECRNSQGCHRRYPDGLALSPSVHPDATRQPIPTVIISGPEPDVVDVPRTPPLARTKSQSTSSSPRDNSWYTFNTYVETPRFSRLSLAADSVVMPVSAKEHKKRQQQQRPQPLDNTPSGSGSQSTDVGISTGGSHSKEVNQQSLIGGLSSSVSRRSTKSNDARRRPATSPTSPPRSQRVPDTLQTSLAHSLLTSTLPSSTSSSSSSPDSSPHRTRAISFTDSLATTFFVPSITSSSQTSVCDDAHQREVLVTIQNVNTEAQCARKPSSMGRAKLAKKKSLLARLGRWTVTSSTVSLPVTMANKDLDKKSTQPLCQSRTEKSSRTTGIRGFFKLFVSSE